MKLRFLLLLIPIALLMNDCAYIRSEISASKAKKQLTEEEEKHHYLLTLFGRKREMREYLLSESGEERQAFLRDFWRIYDPDLATMRNSFYIEILQRYSYAKLKFRYMRTSGEKTQMGRMYIKYGPPADISRNPPNMERDVHQEIIIWEYDHPKNFRVAFKDDRGTGDFQIITGYDSLPVVTGSYFRKRTLKEVREARNEEN